MNKREQLMAVAIGGCLALLGAGYLGKKMFQKPLLDYDKKITAVRGQLYKIKTERATYFKDEARVKAFAQRTFADEPDRASARSGELLTRLIHQSGLREADFSRLPFGPHKMAAGIDTVEFGWMVQGEGKLENVVDLLFLVQEMPYLHRVEGLTLTPSDAPGRVRVAFRLLTLVIRPAPPVEFAELGHKLTLYSPERKIYDGIVARDLLRPYIKRPPAPSPGSPAPKSDTPSGVPPGPENYKIVGLSDWMGQPEIHLLDIANRKTMRFRAGEALAGGSIEMVDYRALPKPGKEFLMSGSRVIVKIGTEYWAVELGQTLAQKYRLAPAQLPEQLVKLIK